MDVFTQVSQFNESIIASIQEHNFTSLDNTLSKADGNLSLFLSTCFNPHLIPCLNHPTRNWTLNKINQSLFLKRFIHHLY